MRQSRDGQPAPLSSRASAATGYIVVAMYGRSTTPRWAVVVVQLGSKSCCWSKHPEARHVETERPRPEHRRPTAWKRLAGGSGVGSGAGSPGSYSAPGISSWGRTGAQLVAVAVAVAEPLALPRGTLQPTAAPAPAVPAHSNANANTDTDTALVLAPKAAHSPLLLLCCRATTHLTTLQNPTFAACTLAGKLSECAQPCAPNPPAVCSLSLCAPTRHLS